MQFKPKATIDKWSVIPRPGGEDPFHLILIGIVSEHPEPEANGCCFTSKVLWFSPAYSAAETVNTFYSLGDPDPIWIEKLAAEGKSLIDLGCSYPPNLDLARCYHATDNW
jgi:hypothetical protein